MNPPRLILVGASMCATIFLFLNLASTPAQQVRATEWKLIWSDEFEGKDGSGIDSSKWTNDVGGSGWGNHELQYYTDRLTNVSQAQGMLVIKALQEHYTGSDKVSREYTSARVTTRKSLNVTYGRFESRIKVPYGQGIWPAFWLLGQNIENVGWPSCGEIDIMELIGKEPANVYATIHGPGYSGTKGISVSFSLKNNERFTDGFHVFALEWEPEVLRFYCDGTLYQTLTPSNLPRGTKWVYDRPYFVLLNLAVGGVWPGNPDTTTTFPQFMYIDYVRVFQRATAHQSTD
jgi:beta-glucanase (GH16 family)